MEIMKRDQSVEMLKFVAALMVVNSHIGIMYVADYKQLATGGAIGDELFFFCSGFTLFLSSKPLTRFDHWYKNRINRIYPAVFMWAIITSALHLTDKTMVDVVLFGGGWFVSAIMVYYVIFYLIKKYFINRLFIPIIAVGVLLVAWCVFVHDSSNFSQIYYSRNFSSRIIGFFFMLFGACLGLYSKTHKMSGGSALYYACMTILSVLAYYGTLYVCGKYPALHFAQFISVVPMVALIYNLYRLCNTDCILRLYNMRYIHAIVYLIGSLCLEMYICQFVLFTDRYNHLFPLNVILIFPTVILVAYGLRVSARVFQQTFKDGNYNWREILSI